MWPAPMISAKKAQNALRLHGGSGKLLIWHDYVAKSLSSPVRVGEKTSPARLAAAEEADTEADKWR